MKKVASGCQGKHICHPGETRNRKRLGICGGRADEEISHELYELISAPASGIIFCNLLEHVGGKDHCLGVSMSLVSPEVQGIKSHCSSLKLKLQSWGVETYSRC